MLRHERSDMLVTAKMTIELAGAPNSGNANSGAGMGIGIGGMRSQLRAKYTTEANNTPVDGRHAGTTLARAFGG
jgi:hypothetical protein